MDRCTHPPASERAPCVRACVCVCVFFSSSFCGARFGRLCGRKAVVSGKGKVGFRYTSSLAQSVALQHTTYPCHGLHRSLLRGYVVLEEIESWQSPEHTWSTLFFLADQVLTRLLSCLQRPALAVLLRQMHDGALLWNVDRQVNRQHSCDDRDALALLTG